MNGERVYEVDDIWEDRDGDEWEVHENGCLRILPGGVASLTPEYVDSRWGPLTLKKPAEGSDVPLTEWEKQILADAGHPKFQPDSPPAEVEFNFQKIPTEFARGAEFRISEDIIDRLDPVFVGNAVGVYEEALELLLRKNADYGSKNISESPGGPLNGLRVRMWDKMARINNLMDSGFEAENEPLRDSFADLLNYSAIALMVLDGKWPGTEEM